MSIRTALMSATSIYISAPWRTSAPAQTNSTRSVHWHGPVHRSKRLWFSKIGRGFLDALKLGPYAPSSLGRSWRNHSLDHERHGVPSSNSTITNLRLGFV